MKKYIKIATNTWEEMLTYRLSFVMWRVRNVFSILTIYFLWFSIFPSNNMFGGYTRSMMLTYILGTSLVASIVLSSRTIAVGDEINQGNLSNFLIKPINYFSYWFAKDIGDKAMNVIFSIAELLILFFILRPPLFLQTNLSLIFLSFTAVIIALFLFFFFNFLLGLVGFWSPEVWAPRFIFFTILTFFAGGLFPLDILPKAMFLAFQITPFPYLLYFPLKIYLGQLPISEIYLGIFISLIWVFLMFVILKTVWEKGLKLYSAEGR